MTQYDSTQDKRFLPPPGCLQWIYGSTLGISTCWWYSLQLANVLLFQARYRTSITRTPLPLTYQGKGTPPRRKIDFFWALPKLPPPPNSGKLYNFFGRHKRCLARITEPSNYDYDNDVSDNCDHNFCTFDDFGDTKLVLKMTKKYHITWHWCQNIRDNMVEKR